MVGNAVDSRPPQDDQEDAAILCLGIGGGSPERAAAVPRPDRPQIDDGELPTSADVVLDQEVLLRQASVMVFPPSSMRTPTARQTPSRKT
jgi:hypothetical protein